MRANNANKLRFANKSRFAPTARLIRGPFKQLPMPACYRSVPLFIAFFILMFLWTHSGLAQNSAELQTVFLELASFNSTDFAALHHGEPVVALLPAQDKKEVAVYGLVRVEATAEMFLQSFRDSIASKSNPAILEIGRFSKAPTLDDLQTLTMEDGDIEDLKRCVVGDCQLKLSANMIDRFHKELNWQAPDYAMQATQLFKVMLLEYVRDYLQRGDRALIQYNDKPIEVRLAEEQDALFAASGNDILSHDPKDLKNPSRPDWSMVENAIVWSKFKFGLKPVLAINHIVIYKREQEAGPQILIASKQIYANHYFNSSLALTTFVNNPVTPPESYLVYEHRSRVDGLGGMFGKLKRGIVERESIAALKGILRQTKMNFDARALNRAQDFPPENKRSWRGWKLGGIHVFMWLFAIMAVGFLALSAYQWKASVLKEHT